MAQQGFSLLELLATVTIIAILALGAYPSYRSHLLTAHRQRAQIQLHEAAQQLERYYHKNHGYSGASIDISNDNYSITATTLTEHDYTLSAAPTGSQSKDPCGTMTLNHHGQQTAEQPSCWS